MNHGDEERLSVRDRAALRRAESLEREMMELIEGMGSSRELSHARNKMTECLMWIERHLRRDKKKTRGTSA